jgi:hypothetical protein
MGQRPGRRGISRLAVALALIVVLAIAGGYLFVARGPTNPQTSTTASGLVPVRTAVDQFLSDFNSRNIDAVVTFYTPTSLVVWSGHTGGLVGQYHGAENIRLIYATSVGKTTAMSANLSNYQEQVFSPTHVNTTFTLKVLGNSTVMGILTATVNVSQEWNWGSSGWQIIRENWAYDYFDATNIDAGIPSSTTFPQWGVMRMGGNPNLVSEKSFEWHAGPYLAIGVYAFISSIAFIFGASWVLKRRVAGPK